MEKFILGSIEKHLKENSVVGHSQNSFMRAESCLSNLISYHGRVTHPADQGKSVDAIFLDFDESGTCGPICAVQLLQDNLWQLTGMGLGI